LLVLDRLQELGLALGQRRFEGIPGKRMTLKGEAHRSLREKTGAPNTGPESIKNFLSARPAREIA
jgi:hypothetical protein